MLFNNNAGNNSYIRIGSVTGNGLLVGFIVSKHWNKCLQNLFSTSGVENNIKIS